MDGWFGNGTTEEPALIESLRARAKKPESLARGANGLRNAGTAGGYWGNTSMADTVA